MKIFIKNMISTACKLFVQAELKKLGINYNSIHLGEVELNDTLTLSQRTELRSSLTNYGFELMEDRRAILIEKIKSTIIDMIYYKEDRQTVKYSCILSEKFNHNYNYMAKLFPHFLKITLPYSCNYG